MIMMMNTIDKTTSNQKGLFLIETRQVSIKVESNQKIICDQIGPYRL